MYEICVAKFDVYECRKSDRASAVSGAQLIICAAQTPEFPDTIPTIRSNLCGISHIFAAQVLGTCAHMLVSHNAQWPLAFVLGDNRVRIHKPLDDHLQDNWSVTNNHLFFWRSYNVEVLWLYEVGIATSRSPGNRKWAYCKTWIWQYGLRRMGL